ncbi:BTB/POZ and MATH domain-containing protein 1-like [Lolium rigidum]|uniref:BTB/POZ and MATH domain-containing protein 1-like n=1 Tax=Lolium rigidum TaxID=89674 RepID=UPI001F5D412F|nr:BTB/POZ and MATH domain-containing protein 1-like [Lolium rigidum]
MSSVSADVEWLGSTIVVDTSSGHHLLTIHGYSRTKGLPAGEYVMSRPFSLGGHRWRICYYPNGENSEFSGYISVSLILDEDGAAAVKAQWDICFAGEEEAEQVSSLASRPVHEFTSENEWFCNNLATKEELESSGHLRNDSFTVRCDIVVVQGCRAVDFVSVPPCDLGWHLGELLETGKGADVVFKVGGETVAAHRCVLAARSLVFSAELFGPMKEGNAASVRVEDMEADVFKMLLRFAYTGSLPEMGKEDEGVTCQHLLVAADRYDMERLKLICEERLCEYIDVGSAATILALAEQHHCEGLKKACFSFLSPPAILRAVMATKGFQHLIWSCPSIVVELMAMSCPH